MKFMNLCLALFAAAGLTMLTGCGDTSEPPLSERQTETPEDITAETPAEQPEQDVQYGAPERAPDTRFDADFGEDQGADLDQQQPGFVSPEAEQPATDLNE